MVGEGVWGLRTCFVVQGTGVTFTTPGKRSETLWTMLLNNNKKNTLIWIMGSEVGY